MTSIIKKLQSDCAGATAIEYALIASAIGIVIVGSVTSVGTSLDAIFASVSGGFN